MIAAIIRIMPDVHAGKGCTIGTTMTVTDKTVPNIVGVDIGCGMYTVSLGKAEMESFFGQMKCRIIDIVALCPDAETAKRLVNHLQDGCYNLDTRSFFAK